MHQLARGRGPLLELGVPRLLLAGDVRVTLLAPLPIGLRRTELAEQLRRVRLHVGDREEPRDLAEPPLRAVAVDLDQRRVLRPVRHVVLREEAEDAESRAQREHDVGLRDRAHGRLRAAVAEGPAAERMAVGEGVVVEVGVDHRGAQVLGQRPDLVQSVALADPASRDDDGVLRGLEQTDRLRDVFARRTPGARRRRREDLVLDVPVEVVPGNVELGRAQLELGPVEAAPRELRHPVRSVDPDLVDGLLLEHRHLVELLEAAGADAPRSRLRRDRHDRGVRPIGRSDRRDEVRRARPVLRDAGLRSARDAREAVGGVGRRLLVRHGDEADARVREEVQRVHESRPDQAEHVRHPLGDERLHQGLGRCHLLLRHHSPRWVRGLGARGRLPQ